MGVISSMSSSNRLWYGTRCGCLIRNTTGRSWSSWERCRRTHSKRAGHSSAAVLVSVVWRGAWHCFSNLMVPHSWGGCWYKNWEKASAVSGLCRNHFNASFQSFDLQDLHQNEFCTRSESADAFFSILFLTFFWLKHLSPNSDTGWVVTIHLGQLLTHTHTLTYTQNSLLFHTSHFHTLTSSHFLDILAYYYICKVWLCFWQHLWQSQTAPQGASAPRLQRGGLTPPTRTFYSEVILWNVTVCL